MIVLKHKVEDLYSIDEYVSLSLDNGILSLSRLVYGGKSEERTAEDFKETSEISLDLNSLFEPYTQFTIYYDMLGNFSKAYNSTKLYSSRNGVGTIVTYDYIDPKIIVNLYFHNTADEVLIMVFVPAKVSNSTNYIVRDKNEYHTDIIASYYPEYSDILKAIEARNIVLSSMDPNNSLAYLEAQVDILSKTLFSILNKVEPSIKSTVIKEIPNLREFEDIVNDTSVLNIKDFSKCLDEIRVTKKNIRHLQEQYYKAKVDDCRN